MKAKFLFPLLVLGAQTVFSQTAALTPDVLSQPQFYDKAHHVLVKLEKAVAKYGGHAKGMGFGGYTISYDLDGGHSSVRLQIPENGSFVVQLADGTGDPSALFSLFRAEVKKDKRSAASIQGKTGMFSIKSSAGNGIISYEVKKLGNNLFEIIPSVRLDKGEYLFINKGSLGNYGGQGADAFAFGID